MAIQLSKGQRVDLTKTNYRADKSDDRTWLGYE